MNLIKPTLRIRDLFDPAGGFHFESKWVLPQGDEPRFLTKTLMAGSPSVGQFTSEGDRERLVMRITGSGTDLDEERAERAAFGEALERLCSASYQDEQYVTATAAELGSRALDLDCIPRCSDKELAHPACPLVFPRKDQVIRWVRAVSLLDGKIVFVPAVMTYLYLRYAHPGERIWLPISTGCAAHTSLEKAVLSGIMEVVERDAISITWLQRLPLPRIEVDDLPSDLKPYWLALDRGSTMIQPSFFDATTDIGFPTVYGIQVCSTVPEATTLVSCSTALNPAEALAKTIRDMAHIRVAFRHRHSVPESWDEFTSIFHGAAFMARAEHASAFNFLLESKSVRRLSELSRRAEPWKGNDREQLTAVIQRLQALRLNVYAVELSTDEALRAGIRVVRVIIPGLQPLSVHYRARFLGHDRLYQCPQAMGHDVYRESELNSWPQAFA